MKQKVAILIPIYKATLNKNETLSLETCRAILHQYPIIFYAPEGLKTDFVGEYPCIFFEQRYFDSIRSYNLLMLSSIFYEKLKDFEFILIYQLDALVLKDELLYWCDKNYDYIGASWIHKKRNILRSWWYRQRVKSYLNKLKGKKNVQPKLRLDYLSYRRVGNGGFSLRKVEAFYNLTKEYKDWAMEVAEAFIPEDIFFCVLIELYQKGKVKLPNYEEGIAFAFEMHPKKAYKTNNYQLPFGYHDFENWGTDFLEKYAGLKFTP